MADFDTAAASRVVAEGGEAVRAAYRRVFAGQDGRTVLLDLMVWARVGHPREPDAGPEARAFYDGRASLALNILKFAGVDAIAATAAIITTALEGTQDDHGYPDGFGDPDPEF